TETLTHAQRLVTDLSTNMMIKSSLLACFWSSFFSQRTFWPPPPVRATSTPFHSSPSTTPQTQQQTRTSARTAPTPHTTHTHTHTHTHTCTHTHSHIHTHTHS